MQKLSEAPDKKEGDAYSKKKKKKKKKKEPSRQKKETYSLSAVTGGLTTLKSFWLLVESPTCPYLGGTLVNIFTSSCRLFYQNPRL